MQIKLHRVRGSNALAYGDFDFILDEHTVYQLIGKNGSGKSSLPTIIEEILYNNNSRGLKKQALPNRYTDVKGWWGEVTFFVGTDEYIVHKEVKSAAKVKLYKNSEDISGHTATQTYKLIKEILGDTEFKTFSKLVYQSMSSSMDFLTSTDANRKKFLVSLLGLEGYSEIEAALKEARKDATSILNTVKAKTETIEKWLKRNSTIPDELSLVDVPENDSGLEKSLSEKNVDLRTAELHNKQVESNEKLVQDFEAKKLRKEELHEKVLQLQENSPAPAEDFSSEIQSVTRDLATKQAEMAAEKSTYQKFRDEASVTKCHTCGSHLDVTQKAEARDAAKERFMAIKPIRDELQEKLGKLQDKQSEHREYLDWQRKMENATTAYETFQVPEQPDFDTKPKTDTKILRDDIKEIQNKINKLKTDIENANRHNTDALVNNAKREEILKTSTEYRVELDKYQVELQEAQLEVDDLDLLCKAFGSKGLISYKIESSVKVFEELINKYLSKFTSGQFALGFELDSTKLKVVIYDDGIQVGMESLSSGEQSKVNVSTLLAIRNLMSAVSDVNINLLFLDEVISVLDDDSRDLLVELLLEETHLNTFLVSHGYNHPLTKDIRLEKRNKVSTVVNG
ncbi:putative endonuclease subunit 2 [Vibrio phage Achelous]|uniref:Putative exonuclease subunit 2 n=2 Tax=Thalassavirus TaxID=2948922 RepID=A0A4Y6E7N3_9CAUD|nr:putative endonuclease subunit 2 [Vibrio phage Achelous]YP_010102474.1 putative exonuclease subunit 2 [Vibrio phage Brizo]QCQ57636.1 putative endonuclease subunit 2 [Vibrio phage Achelous]QDF14452.1 putative exonuclease subunit 2 [Vibrio phage Brizo]